MIDEGEWATSRLRPFYTWEKIEYRSLGVPQGPSVPVCRGEKKSLATVELWMCRLSNTIINTGHMMTTSVPIHSLPVTELLYSHGLEVAVPNLVRTTGPPALGPIHTTAFAVTRCRQAGLYRLLSHAHVFTVRTSFLIPLDCVRKCCIERIGRINRHPSAVFSNTGNIV